MFKEVAHDKIGDPRGRLTRLISNTQGEAKYLVKTFIQKHVGVDYQNARKLIDKRDGYHKTDAS